MPRRSRLAIVVIDTQTTQREAAVRFWSAALGRTRRPADDPTARYAHLQTPAGPTLDVIVQGTTPEHAGLASGDARRRAGQDNHPTDFSPVQLGLSDGAQLRAPG